MTQRELSVRQATAEDYEDVVAFTSDIWADRGGDYIPDVFHDWIAGDGDGQRTFVVDAGDDLAGILQMVMLSDHEAWAQGMRTNPEFRGQGAAALLNEAGFEWAADRGATVARNMVFSWNDAGLGAARASGFAPGVEFRWACPEPDADALAAVDEDAALGGDPDAAWRHWQASDAADVLDGLALDRGETYALSELTIGDLRAASEDERVVTVEDDGTRAMTFRTREYKRDGDDGEPVQYVEYGVASWADVDAARALFAAIEEDAAARGADATRVMIPESARHVSDAAYVRAQPQDEPKFVLACDLTDRR
ncbi:MAG: N-acetyltransferase family protein [Halobacterium sp.]